MMSTLIKNADIVTQGGVLTGADLFIKDGRITLSPCEVDEVIDADGAWLLPGFVDIHCHGGGGLELMDADACGVGAIADFHLAHGTTSLVATTLAADDSETLSALDNIARYMNENPDSSVVGVHLEGPWFNPLQCGAQNTDYIRPPRDGELESLKARYPFILRVSAAPECEGGMKIANDAKRLGIVAAIGHTDAEFSEVEEAHERGYSLMTHLYSGMKGVTRKNSFRIAGAVEAGLYLDDMYVELIADGCHLPVELLRLVYKIKGPDRICLITDAIRAAGMPDGTRTKIGSMERGLDVIVEDGVAKLPDRQSFAGSTATADRLFKNMMEATGGNVVAVSKMASSTPAYLMGLTDRGEIAEGKRADLVLMDKNYNIKNVFLNGEKI